MAGRENIKVGIVGAAGYTAGELLRILVNHPAAHVVFAQSGSHAGEPVWSAHQDLLGETDLKFSADAPVNDADVIFICSGHGKSKDFVHGLKGYDGAIIDLSNDFRLAADAEDFVYGLPEAFRSKIVKARHIANPGCFATAIQLALLPAAKAGILPEVHVTGITGSTGAGQAPSEFTHFSWRANNLSVYKAFTHQHLGEICQTLGTLEPDWCGEMNFVPVRGDFTRGILVSAYFDCSLSEDEAVNMYNSYYENEPFVFVISSNPDMKMVVNTNKCFLNVQKHGNKLHIVSVLDNLVKGASGQAVENMNLIFGLPEDTALHLKATRF
jgi:N-acetyl-gamma-glutamyl-phosphate reductase